MTLRLEDIERIKQLKHRYMRMLDSGDSEGLAGCFVPEATIRYEGGSYLYEANGRDEIIAMLGQMQNNQYVGMHLALMPEIDVAEDGAVAEGRWYMVDWAVNMATNRMTHGTALYHDHYVHRDGEWRIRHSGYVRLFERVEMLKEPIDLKSHAFARFGPPMLGGVLPR
ncbi:nuclear transport factor 2 family protein [Sphingomonas fennica]|uniref:Nuclear transport factor 2 family protein n=1 Tax=Edaphosphingomonas fennica TaxID=114404 RepID=A0A2T4I140_9SPHN|nr:nuclear transport factor 2 family protein [Sphingomonas fennica]PTD22513.1 nuclear transport factor 2 family protein [Sphingomonas fennica]